MVLLVNAEPALTNLVKMALHYEGWRVGVAHTGHDAVRKLAVLRPDIVVLDIALPDASGLDVLTAVRQREPYTPTLLLTARDSMIGRAIRITAWADDYMPKPFSLEELVAKLRRLLHRSSLSPLPENEALRVGGLILHTASHEVTRDRVPISLTGTEFEVLHYLMRHPGRILSRPEIVERVWNYRFAGRTTIVDLYISYLRKKIDAGREPMIHTVRGLGYMLRPADGA
ncbi:response regulator transcription factor [Mycolicibacterium mucogenicum]|nr:response regulator transcription factor [Mycolicibacterium mucogenicum]